MNHVRTFRLDRLYNQFLKSRGIPADRLPLLVTLLYQAGFIDLVQEPDLISERYFELEKLTSREHRDELFKIIGGLK